ncbi:MAG: bifunctional (p)ppGpp synthetase/guanosine-3',5'-bis(diphosphate) 3'-pyrophosphohydrolase [Spirosomaceae bacterium]|nr:bifunctional (p)ppGpp synthetase/guanosine-3',5'-bis(diphosphate) 3'-pyrophosphohydrolase [Spirosomataceae bacterium]
MELVIDLEQERQEILKRYRKLLRAAKPLLKDNDAKLIKKAFHLSAEAHKDMRRKSGEPYIFHPLEVAQICVEEIGLGTTSIICALLHDVVEDTHYTLTDMEREFGPKVAQIIDGLTKISGQFEFGTSQQAENFRKMLLTLSDDIRVILIKLADRLHNMRTLDSMARDKQLKIASETIFVYAPLAHRLGLHAIKTELEDLHLKYTEPEDYNFIREKLRATRLSRDRFISKFIEPIENDLREQGYNFAIKGRPKSIYSIWNKMRRQKKTFEEIYDLFAVRVIMDSADPKEEKSDCWHAYSIVTDYYTPNIDRLKDWLATPRANGYESLHITVMYRPEGTDKGQWVEVQIRSKRMDEIAEKGVAAHWKYKGNDTKTGGGIDQWISQVREMLETTRDSKAAALDFLDDFRSNLFAEEVFVFTPKGELRVLQRGATALDFAFDIHTHVGAHCIAAKVNNNLVPISHTLNNGDQVEIITAKRQKPSEDWLKFVVTSKAKARIKDLIKEENKQYITDGRSIIEKRCKILHIEVTHELINQLRAYFNCKTPNDLYYRFGKGYIQQDEIRKFKQEKEAKANVQQAKINTDDLQDGKQFTKELRKIHGERADADALLIGEDMDKIDYILSKCCNPIPGDDVFGFVTVNEGIKIHRTSCPNAPELLSNHGNRVIKAKWTSQQKIAFLAGLKIDGTDRVGLVNDLTRIISNELHINIRSISVETDEGIFEGYIKLYVYDTRHLDDLMKKLDKVEGVYRVTRFD